MNVSWINDENVMQYLDQTSPFLTLADNKELDVLVLGAFDYVGYKAHEDAGENVPCLGKECKYCDASDAPRDRYIFAVVQLSSGKLKGLDVSKEQAKRLIYDIDKHGHFRTNEGELFSIYWLEENGTCFMRMKPITFDKTNGLQEVIERYKGKGVPMSFYEMIFKLR